MFVGTINPFAGATVLGTGAAGNAYNEMINAGYSKNQARNYAVLVGGSEAGLSYLLGGISEFGGLPAKLGEKIAAIDNALLKGAAKLAVSEFGEVSEELLQNYLEPLFRTFIFGEEYDEPTLQENLDTILTTLISTGTMEGPGIVSATVSEIKNPTGSGVRYDFGVTQEDIDQYVESAYENKNKQDYKKYAEVSDRLKNDVQKEIVIEGYAHALRDNDIRHIRNSHGEKTKEKYPVTKQDIKNIPWIVENYDKVYTIKRRDGKTGLVYVTVNNQGTVYYLEQVTSKYGNEPLLINKQMIKTGIGDIPGLPGLKEAITKKQSETEFLNDLRKAQQVYAQSVYQSHSNAKVTQTDTNVNDQNSLSAQRQADAGNVSKVGWDGRVAVTEAKGPNITIDGVTYRLLGLDKNGSKVYQDVEVLKEQSKQTEESRNEKTELRQEAEEGILKTPGELGEKAVPYSERGIEIEPRIKGYLGELQNDADYIVRDSGEIRAQDLAVLTTETGVEFTVVTVDGKDYLIRGDEKSTTIPSELVDIILNKKGTITCHSHPFIGDLMPSKSDLNFLKRLTWQTESVIVDPTQQAVRFTMEGPVEVYNLSNTNDGDFYNSFFGGGE